eukprot:TRINITY_DN2180_c0_g1_i2.p1 TRINITY_DN2180_c0_g1~~TRINITY_DN2180_c0_g1_i2.p1  ORF type:complete len:632 (-),score=161.68 TRINITY_DN2180_c0_g1_i2:32-1714(-)
MATLDRLYDIAAKLDSQNLTAQTATPESRELYKEIISSVHSTQPGSKQLGAQFISKYFGIFPELSTTAIDGLIDLCEEDDSATRIQAIRAIPQICKESREHTPRLADILVQLLQTDRPVELDNIKNALVSLLRVDSKGTLEAIFSQIQSDQTAEDGTPDDSLKIKAVSFLREKIVPLKDLLVDNQENQRFLGEKFKTMITDCSSQVQTSLLDLLKFFPLYRGQVQVISIPSGSSSTPTTLPIIPSDSEPFDFDAPFEPKPDYAQKLISKLVFKRNSIQQSASSSPPPNASKEITYLGTKVLPTLTPIINPKRLADEFHVPLLQILADLSPYATPADARTALHELYNLFILYCPSLKIDKGVKINFSVLEALLLAFHHLGSKVPSFLRGLCGFPFPLSGQPSDTLTLPPGRKEDTYARLGYITAEITPVYLRKLNEALAHKKREAQAKTGEEKEKALNQVTELEVAIKSINNVNTLAQGLKKVPLPQFFKIPGSWRQETLGSGSSAKSTLGSKRPWSASTTPTTTTTTTTTATTSTASSSKGKEREGNGQRKKALRRGKYN